MNGTTAQAPLGRRLLLASAGNLGWVALFSCALNLIYLAAPLYMMQVYDRVLHSQSVPTLLYLTLAVAICYATYAVLDAVRTQVLAGISDIVEANLAASLLRQTTAPAGAGRARPGASPIGRDLDTVRQFAAGPAMLAFVDLPWAPIYLVVISMLHWALGVFALVACLVLVALTLVAERAARGPMTQAGAVAGRAYQFGDAIARQADCASTMGLGPRLAARWSGLRQQMLDAQNQASRRAALLGAAARFARLFTQSAILGVGAWLSIRHELSGGAIFAGSLLLGRCLAPVEAVIGSWRGTLAARDSWGRILAVGDTVSGSAIRLPEIRGEVALQEACWTPPGMARAALSGISLTIEAGAVLAVIGPNAAGKSTLGRMLSGAIRPDSGIVRLDGAEYAAWNAAQLGDAIGYLPQEIALFPGTVRENIARFADAADEAVIAASTAAGAHDMILRLPEGYQTQAGDHSGALSAGQRQRVALARALFGDPKVLILDEPNASLDAAGETALLHCVVAARAARRTVILITHCTALVRLADHVATMVGGRILRVQAREDFFARPVSAGIAVAPIALGAGA